MANARGVTDVKIYDPAAVEERFGVPPRLIPDLIGLKGDTSDNIPGIPGIGEKTAAQLLQQFGDLDGVLSNIDKVAGPKRQELLRENQEIALLSRRLACLDHDAPIDIHTAEVLPHQVQRDRLQELFRRFEFHTLLERVDALSPVPPAGEGGEDRGAASGDHGFGPPTEAAAERLLDPGRRVGAGGRRGDRVACAGPAGRGGRATGLREVHGARGGPGRVRARRHSPRSSRGAAPSAMTSRRSLRCTRS